MTCSHSVQIEDDLLANYEVETFSYFLPPNEEDSSNDNNDDKQSRTSINVSIQSATSTRGSHLVSHNRDRTGIMIWPATHLLCQFIASNPWWLQEGSVLELGAGVGLVGIVACACKIHVLRNDHLDSSQATATRKQQQQQQQSKLHWVSTDMDETALQLIERNQQLNQINSFDTQKCNILARKLQWGNMSDIERIQNDLCNEMGSQQFDTIVGADIVYPTTSGQVLQDLFVTVNSLLKEDGIFYLSFCTRDGCKTPQRLIQAASQAHFAIQSTPALTAATLDPEVQKRLPPLLDSVLLKLIRDPDAASHNQQLGTEHCLIFPRLHLQIQQLQLAEAEKEHWDPPFADDSEE